MTKIPSTEVSFSPLSVIDIGRVFWWQGRLFRGILTDYVSEVEALFKSGLLDKLIDKNLFVKSSISTFKLEGFGLVIEHEPIAVVVYPKEWTFSMLKDAAALVLHINSISYQYGYQTKDCHGYNVLFKNSKPIYIDLGSFCKTSKEENTLISYDEFMRSYYFPLKIWQVGGKFWGVGSAVRVGCLISVSDYLKFRWSVCRWLSNSILDRAVHAFVVFLTIRQIDRIKLTKVLPFWVISLLAFMSNVVGATSIKKLTKKVDALKIPNETTIWSKYHDEFCQDGVSATTPRFDFVVDRVRYLGIKTVLEFGGNQGALARLLAKKCELTTVICTDADAYALDKGYRLSSQICEQVTWALFNPFNFEIECHEMSAETRFRLDAVIVMAVTHHLILTQNLPIDYIFDTFSKFTKAYLFIEFMPLGLHDGVTAPSLPIWYTTQWFKDAFMKRFDLVDQVQLEENRIMFIGKKCHACE
jgi:hypothetical protein